MGDRVEGAEGQTVRLAGAALRRDHQDQRLLVLDGDATTRTIARDPGVGARLAAELARVIAERAAPG